MFQITLHNDLSALQELEKRLAEFSQSAGLSRGTQHQLCVVIEELFVNFVHHGARQGGQLHVALNCEETRLRIRLEDDGVAFNPLEAEAPDVNTSLDEREVGGLGLHLVRQLSDELTYHRDGERNVVELVLPRA